MLMFKFLVVVVVTLNISSSANFTSSIDKYFLVELNGIRGVFDAIQLARDKHFKFIRPVSSFENVYLFKKLEYPNGNEKRSMPERLKADPRVLWASQQKLLNRDKRDFQDYALADDYFQLNSEPELSKFTSFNDELWNQQWYMKSPSGNGSSRYMDLNVMPVYAKGITGYGVKVAVLDDGIEYDHDDLGRNYDPEISWNCNENSPNAYPDTKDSKSHHGTRCAGEIAMLANNKKCGVGIAFDARIGGIKLLAGDVYDLIEGMALGFRNDKVDIYSSSWGPTDDGKTLEMPGPLARKALRKGIFAGRHGLGNIYVWASGNGGSRDDNCNCDGYVGSIYTIAVGSVTEAGTKPWYSEKCASLMTVTQSSGHKTEKMIATTDVGNTCTVKHTGTSASAPLAAGIIALGLQANPSLTWRDVQHIIIQSSQYYPLSFNNGWKRNGAGLHFNVEFGFGLMNAERFVELAENWTTVPWQLGHSIEGRLSTSEFNLQEPEIVFLCKKHKIESLEHVTVKVNVMCKQRGMLKMTLTSPSGMTVDILETRSRDKSAECFQDWTFMSVATWYENPYGKWSLKIKNNGDIIGNIWKIGKMTLELFGTRRRKYYLNNI